jgi:SpoVK/Ycf46/Vps4 family AAA+-type ATPase
LGPDLDFAELANETDGMVGSEIALICRRATMTAITELIHANTEDAAKKLSLTRTHFVTAIEKIRESE